MKLYYVTRLIGMDQYWLDGPFLCHDVANVKKEQLRNISVDDCPEAFRTGRKSSVGVPGFVMITKLNRHVETWLGSCVEQKEQKSLF